MRKVNPLWKLITAALCLLLTVLIWQRGLQESFDRPSVTPKISIRQSELAFLSSSSIPEPFQQVFVGTDPKGKLTEMLRALPEDLMEERQKFVLSLLDESEEQEDFLLKTDFEDSNLTFFKNLLKDDKNKKSSLLDLLEVRDSKADPLLFQLSCLELGGSQSDCIDLGVGKNMAFRLVLSQSFPFFASLLGVVFLIRHGWLILKKKNMDWPYLPPFPLSVLDMVILVAGGFVVIGEVIFPSLVVPIFDLFLKNISTPLRESLRVLIGYASMTVAPLLILRRQLDGIRSFEIPDGGWLQLRLRPVLDGVSKSVKGWLMIMPLVLLTGLIMNLLVGDQGGSNPLLELVLESKEAFPLILLLLTTVVLAPLFEELVFRGVLLPVLVTHLGRFWGVILSALVFALAHLSVGELPPLFVLGLGLAILRLSTGRLFPCTLMHSLWNGVTFTSLLLVGL